MLVKIKRACNEGEYNINGHKYEVDSLRTSLYDYINMDENNVCIYDKHKIHTSIKNIDSKDILGKIISFDKEYIYVEIYSVSKFNAIEEPIALLSLDCDIMDRTYMVHKVNKIVKIEIGSNKELNII